MKILYFTCRGEEFKVRKDGIMMQANSTFNSFGEWIFLGISKHHWRNGLDVTCKEAFKNPNSIIDGLVWDVDYGTTRSWRGRYCGGLPRITNAYIKTTK